MAEFRAFPISGRPRRTYMLICLNKLIFRWPACPFDPDFFWAQIRRCSIGVLRRGVFLESGIGRICEPFHDPLMKDVLECRQRMGEVAMANRLFDVLARRRSWLDRVALGLLVFLATLVAALMGGASA
ncbi:hypothetical protein RFM41_25320 [Mesorhizobium sp. VK25A]|uniref:Uncharacterized protein n=1 Tax=Mesorhizobium vachelliae TaxID=3072309 RepID=A0ABU5A9S2_9HYPH|nr:MULTISPECIES: hypothetical protein [unclassified Mesorhizobium]MDX8534450.1 hypothetical protein [Mesorhizobium sp. VK25D]MDX8547092.1 hypothetical protein [Mesorhizobium sp. VK25A]